ncbi:MAG: NAD(P)-dependent oxidoreductase [Lachnospiraceae bacterium]|nr:NAD(P)-dependent oxidoreductase [Lachnospiraceae bacterium]
MKVLVTGACGYIGRHVVDELIKRNHEVLAADVKFDEINEQAVKIETPIFTGDTDIYEKLGCPDACIHLAWRDGFKHNSENHINDLPSHYNFIKNMLAGGLKNITVMGSMHEVGYFEGAITPQTPTNPESLYGIAKNSLRQITEVLSAQYGAVYKWLRGYYIVGDDLRSNSIFGKIVQSANEGKETFPFTTGKNMYDFISIDELARQIACAGVQTEVDGIINCCTGRPMSLADRVEQFILDNHFSIKLEYGAFPDRPYDSPGVWGDAEKINRILEGDTCKKEGSLIENEVE